MKIGNGKINKVKFDITSNDLDNTSKEGRGNINNFNQNSELETGVSGFNSDGTPIETGKKTVSNESTVEVKSKKDIKAERKAKKKEEKRMAKEKKLSLKYDKYYNSIPKIKPFRVVRVVLMGMIGTVLVAGLSYGVYYNLFRYPPMQKVDYMTSGVRGLDRFLDAVVTLDNETIKGIIGEDSYLAKEVEYANDDERQVKFIQKMLSTVRYIPNDTRAYNIWGYPMVDRNDNPVYTKSEVRCTDERVTIEYIDYDAIEFDAEKLNEIKSELGVETDEVDYSNKLIPVFIEYMLDMETVPLKKVVHEPDLNKIGETYSVGANEDIYLDKLLFSSKEFYNMLDRFSSVAYGGEYGNPEWVEWNKLPDDKKKSQKEPEKKLTGLKPNDSWIEWNNKSKEEKKKVEEPTKYDPKKVISKSWCGAYYLNNEYEVVDKDGNKVKKPLLADVGEGTLEDPAGLNTGIVTSIFVSNDKGERVKKPIRVKLIDYRVSQDAIDYFESKDERNRGFDIKSEVQYASYTFEVTNLSGEEITIYDDSSLCDELANMSPRTGSMYGLQDEVTLKPDETGIIESWGNSTELNTKYLVWGSDFDREEDVVWFRVLAGDLENPDPDKGVALNKSRDSISK